MPRIKLEKFRFDWWIAVFISATFAVLLQLPIANAQQKPRQQQSQNQNSSDQGSKKSLTAARGSDGSDGSRVSLTSNSALSDYSAYRSGNRFYVIIPNSKVPVIKGALKGKGYEDVQVQRQGQDTVLSFQLQPGSNARVDQRANNKLDVVVSSPGGATSPEVSSNSSGSRSKPEKSPEQAKNSAATTAAERAKSSSEQRSSNPETTAGITGASSSRSSSAEGGASPVASPNAQSSESAVGVQGNPSNSQINGAVPTSTVTSSPPALTAIPQTVDNTRSAGFKRFLAAFWQWILLAVLLLAFLLIWALGGRKRDAAGPVKVEAETEPKAVPVPKKTVEKEIPVVAAVSEKQTSLSNTPAPEPAADVRPKTLPVPEDVPLVAPAVVAATSTVNEKAPESTPVLAAVEDEKTVAAAPLDEVPDEGEIVSAARPVTTRTAEAGMENASRELQNLYSGQKYDTTVIDSGNSAVRQFVAAELLSAIAGRNSNHHSRALAAFVQHGYLDETTRNLRIGDSPAARASAARALGTVGDRNATPHLVAALGDPSPEVRRAAVESLADIGDPTASEALTELLQRERDRKVPRTLIQRALDASTPTEFAALGEGAHLQSAAGEAVSSMGSAFVTQNNKFNAVRVSGEESSREYSPVDHANLKASEGESHLSQDVTIYGSEILKANKPTSAGSKRADDEIPAGKTSTNIDVSRPESLEAEPLEAPLDRNAAFDESVFSEILLDEVPVVTPQELSQMSSEAEARDSTPNDSVRNADLRVPEATAEHLVEDSHRGEFSDQSSENSILENTYDVPSADTAVEPRHEVQEEVAIIDFSDLLEQNSAVQAEPGGANIKDIVSLSDSEASKFDLRRALKSEDPTDRASALRGLAGKDSETVFDEICAGFDDQSHEVREAAAQALYDLDSNRVASFTRALREASPDRRRKIGAAFSSSGLADEEISSLNGESRERTYDAFSLLFLMSKTGEVQPLIRAIEDHPSTEIRLAVVKLLALSGQQEILPYFRRLAVRGSLPGEVRSAVMEAIYQISNQLSADAHTAA